MRYPPSVNNESMGRGKKLKKNALFICMVIFIGFAVTSIGNKTTVANDKLDLAVMAAILQDEHIMVHEWSLYTREKMNNLQTVKQVEAYTEEMQKTFSEWTWEITAKAGQFQATAITKRENGNIESIKILSSTDKSSVQTYVTYEMKGQEWDASAEQSIKEIVKSRTNDLYQENTNIFSCIKGEFNGNMNKSLSNVAGELLAAFDAKEIEAIEEGNFLSTTGYSPVLSGGGVLAAEKDMNLQIGLRNQGLGLNTTIVIGTPIITIEY